MNVNAEMKSLKEFELHGDQFPEMCVHFTILFEKLIVVSIEPLLACLVIPTTGLYNNFHS